MVANTMNVHEELQKLAEEFVVSNSSDEQKKVIERVSNALLGERTATILNVVESLGVYLTNDDFSKRRKGTQLLGELMHRLAPNYFNHQENELLALFMVDRLKDHHSIQPQVIYGLLGLVSYHNLTDDHIIKICQTIFSEVHVRSLVQADRRNLFNLYSNLLDKHISALKKMGPDFVLGFIQSMDGEKDPRNLLVCFDNTEKIIAKLPFDVFAEDLFEVTSCYFPIDFTPPSNDPFGVTQEALVLKLRKCLASTPKFAQFCMPLLMEKLSSDIVDAKNDALCTLAECLLCYNSEDVKEYAEDVWNAIRRDYLLGGIKAIEDACLSAIKNLIICLSKERDETSSFVRIVFRDCEHTLKDPDLNMAEQLSVILVTLAYSTPEMCKTVLPTVLKSLTGLLNTQLTDAKLSNIMQMINNLMEFPLTNKRFKIKDFISECRDEISAFHLTLITSRDDTFLPLKSINNLLTLARHHQLSQTDLKIYTNYLLEQIHGTTDQKLLAACFDAIEVISRESLEIDEGFVVNELQTRIQDMIMDRSLDDSRKVLRLANMFQALLLSVQKTTDIVNSARMFLELLHSAELLNPISSEILHFVCKLFGKETEAAEQTEGWLFPLLFKYVKNGFPRNLTMHIDVWKLFVKTLRTMMSNLSEEKQGRWITEIISAIILKEIESNESQQSSQTMQSSESNSMMDTCYDYQRLTLIHAFVCGLKQSVQILEQKRLFVWLENEIKQGKDADTIEHSCKAFASVLNKMGKEEDLNEVLASVLKSVDDVMLSQSVTVNQRKNMMMMMVWVCKSLVLRWHEKTSDLLTKLVSLLHNEIVSKFIGDNFFILMKEYDDCLNAKMHAKMKIMHKQRLVEFILPHLVKEYKSSNDVVKCNFLKAISHLLRQLPKQILQKQISPLIPLLIRSLSFNDIDVVTSTLSTITSFDNPAALKDHVTSLIPRLLTLSRAQESMNVRIQAIACLRCLCNLPVHCIAPYQLKVLRCLKDCLNDKKRLVRKQACKCRNQWYLLEANLS